MQELIQGSVRYNNIVHPDDLERVLAELQGLFDNPENFYTHKPYRLMTRSGEVVWVLDSTTLVRNNAGEITHYNGYLIDVTATVQMEEEMSDSSLYYQDFVEHIHEDDRKSWQDSVDVAALQLLPWKWKGRYIKPSGESLWFEGQATVSTRKGKVVFDGILIDITGVKTLEEEKTKTEIQLHRAQKMEAIGMMAGGVAHDLNNILSGIVSYPDLMLLKLDKDSSLRKSIEAIRESGKRAATLRVI